MPLADHSAPKPSTSPRPASFVAPQDTDPSAADALPRTACRPEPPTARQPEAVTLRRATAADADALALVGAATFLEAFTWMLPGADILAHCARHHTPEAYRAYLAAPDTRITLAEAFPGGAPVGYGMLTAPELPTFAVQPTDIELKRLYLFSRFRSAATPVLALSPNAQSEAHPNAHPEAQKAKAEPVPGLRAGQALMNAAIADARALGRTRLLLGTHAGNAQAIAFYRKNGFAEAGTRTFQVGTQVCCDLIFAKPLGNPEPKP